MRIIDWIFILLAPTLHDRESNGISIEANTAMLEGERHTGVLYDPK
jgi:hypothetical protein